MSFFSNIMFWRGQTEDDMFDNMEAGINHTQRVPLGHTSLGSEAREDSQIEQLNPNQIVNLPSIREQPFVPIDTQQIPIPPEDMQMLENIGYQFGAKLSTGSFGEVYRCQFNDGSNIIELEAKLILMKDTMNENELLEQLNFMRCELLFLTRAVHRHVVAVQNCVTSMRWNRTTSINNYYAWALILLELADSTLEDYLQTRAVVSEEEAKEFLAQIVVSTGYLHSIGVAHRDIKPVNVVLFRNDCFRAGYLLKLCNFGTAHIFDVVEDPNPLTDVTIMYRAPETDQSHWANKENSYDPRLADVYSIGVMFVQMLAGHLNTRRLQMMTGQRKYREKFINLLRKLGKSEEAIDLVDKTVQYDAEDRCTIASILQHPFLPPPVLQEQWMPHE